MAVVLYHFGVPGITGGFAGVDIFFVISGFLMTGIISKGIDRSTFNLLEFYLARARRIIPALAVLCAVLGVAGWFYLVPVDYLKLGKHIASSISFLSNIQYWQDEPAYFNAESRENWLLHTWSLSVEWQFYIIFPLAMLLIRKFCSAAVTRYLIAGAALVSLLAAAYAATRWPSAAFYTPVTRAWELLAGGLVFLFPVQLSKPLQRVLEIVGVILLAISIVMLKSTDVWPGWLTLLPVVGTALMLMAQNTHSPLTSNRIAQSLGEASYSIYLWHWPVVVYIVVGNITPTPVVLCVGISVALVLGYASYYFIERPTRSLGLKAPRLKALSGYAAVSAVILVASVVVFQQDGFRQRASDAVNIASREGGHIPFASSCAIFRGLESPECVLGGPGKTDAPVSVILMGDSHAEFTAAALVESAGKDRGTLLLAYQGCVSVPDVQLQGSTERNQCGAFNRKEFERLKTDYPGVPLVITNRLSLYLVGHNEWPETLKGPMAYFDKPGLFDDAFKQEFTRRYVAGVCELTAHRPVYITAPIPEMTINVPSTYARTLFHTGQAPVIGTSREQYQQRNAFALSVIDAAAKQCGAVILDPTQYFCKDDHCDGVRDGRPLYYDDNHLSAYGTEQLHPMYDRIWQSPQASNP